MIEFDQQRPAAGDRPFEADADGPAQPGLAAGGIARGHLGVGGIGAEVGLVEARAPKRQVRDAVFVARPRGAAGAVQHEAIPAVAEPPDDGRERVGLGVERYRAAVAVDGLAGEERVTALPGDVGPSEVAAGADHPVAGELIVAADLAAAEEARAGVDVDGAADGRKILAERLGRFGKILAAPADPDMAADVAAGP